MYKRFGIFITVSRVDPFEYSFSDYIVSIIIQIWRRKWPPTPVLLPGKSHGWRSLVGYSPWGRQELDTTGQLHFAHFTSCFITGEGNGSPVQCSCLENPMDGGAWRAMVHGVTESRA